MIGPRFAVALTLVVAIATHANAAPPSPRMDAKPSAADAATARGLFDEARKLMKKGKFDEACPKLEEGARLNPGIGMRFNLAECWEHLGRTASAWSLYLDVAADAKEAKQTKRETIARAAAAKLEPKLCRLTIEIEPGAELPGLAITRNGAPIGAGQLGTAVPVDPGAYVVEATAPEHVPWQTKVDVLDAGSTAVVRVPKLRVKPKPPPPPKPAPPPPPGLGPTKTAALVVSGVGVAALGAGLYFGARALSLKGDSDPHCEGDLCDPQGFALRNDARSAGNVSTIVVAVGAVAIATGAVLWLTDGSARSERPKVTALAPWVDATSAGLAIGGAFR